MSVSWGIKDPNEVRSYSYSWVGRLNGAEISSATLTVQTGTVTLSNIANTTTTISATVTGGEECEQVELISRVITDAGETLEETITLSIEASAWVNEGPSTSTKRQLIQMAQEECALSGYEFDVTPEELFSGLRKLDAMMAEWRSTNKDLNYNAPATFGGGDLDDYSGIPDAAISGVSISLALAMAPNMGKRLSVESRQRLATSMNAVRAICARVNDVAWARGTVAGAGNRYRYTLDPFMPTRRPCR